MKRSTLVLLLSLVVAPPWAAALTLRSPGAASSLCDPRSRLHRLADPYWCAAMVPEPDPSTFSIPQE